MTSWELLSIWKTRQRSTELQNFHQNHSNLLIEGGIYYTRPKALRSPLIFNINTKLPTSLIRQHSLNFLIPLQQEEKIVSSNTLKTDVESSCNL